MFRLNVLLKAGQLDSKLVKIPGIYVDAVVECPADDPHQSQSINCTYDPAYSGNVQVPVSSLEPKKLDAKKIIGRRAAMELKKNVVVNLGVGVPEWVSSVAAEEGVADEMTLTVECGPIGGVPAADFVLAVLLTLRLMLMSLISSTSTMAADLTFATSDLQK